MSLTNKDKLYSVIQQAVIDELQTKQLTLKNNETQFVPVSISARHVHLEKKHADILFGFNHRFEKFKDISQPGQYSCVEQVTLIGSKNEIEKVRVVAPLRKQTQVEISMTDARKLGVSPPVRHSGDLKDSAPIKIVGPKGSVDLKEGCIVADRHIHMSPKDALAFNVSNHQKVKIEINGPKGGIMYNVTIRISDRYALDMHIDTDDANAFGVSGKEKLKILK